MLKKMFAGRKRVPFLSQDTRGDNSVESDDTKPKASCSNPTRDEQTRVTYESGCWRVTKEYDKSYIIFNQQRHEALQSYSYYAVEHCSLTATHEELQCLKDMLNTMEELE